MGELNICNSEYCKSHEHVEKTMNRLEEISERLTDGQAKIIGIIQEISRLSSRVEGLEKNQKEIQKVVWKLMGVLGLAGFTLPMVVTYLMKVL